MKNDNADLVTHHTDRISIGGTCLQGYISTTYDRLVAVFGEPMRFEDDKVQAEWNFKIDGQVGAIYDWKEYGRSPESIRDWHVGGFSPDIVAVVERLLA
jgi:hypothetical protein